MISCGEPSGDLYAGALAQALRAHVPDVELFGFGGPRFAAAGGRLVEDFTGDSVVGLTEALKVVPRAWLRIRRLVAAAKATPPDVFVAIDVPDFNFPLMKAIGKLGIPVVYYIGPQVWAWRAGRLATMRQRVKRALVIFPFEEALYRRASVPVEFVGHPLVDLTTVTQPRDAFIRGNGLDPAAPTIALLPGSRRSELAETLPTIARALPLIRREVPDAQFVVACASGLPEAVFAPLVDAMPAESARPVLVRDRTDDVIAAADVVITASGTATVQCALHETPMVVVYRVSPLTYALARRLVKVEHIAMPNIVAGARVVPELVQDDFTPASVAAETAALLKDDERRVRTREALREVRARLGAPGATDRAAAAVLAVARDHQSQRC